jgi:hypothetical protein
LGGAGPTRRSENEPCHPCSSRNNYHWRVVCILRGSLKSGRPYVPRHCLSHGHWGPSYVLNGTHRGYRDCVCNIRMEDPASGIIYWTDCYGNRSSFINAQREVLVLDKVSIFVRRFVAIVGTLLGLCFFILIGGSIWVVMIVRAILKFSFVVFVSAVKTSGKVDSTGQQLLHNSISFFPTGLQIIISNFLGLWHGVIPATGTEVPKIDFPERILDLALAVLFWLIILLFLLGYISTFWMWFTHSIST